ncbi:MFS transporter [Jatrophihabitans cynanchi]|uniref:MFS transporter n=1 Tax=Jatrophihabitans cynanchi TaxID=2944128 RepID=A0ABY7K4P6_9ACTN|nr:MFS transporter [Jatrophihabitans sp. SB3-54]WAX58086.1 MFS transporter [Jatrophihabitans sp. SB3-54]
MATTVSDRTDVTARAGRPATDWRPLLVVLVGTFMTFLDFFIVNVALPSIHDELHAGPDAVQLVVAGYGLAFAVGMISGGRLGDLYGRRRMFALGLALFTLTSAACGLAPNADVLVVARVLQGVAGALLTPQVLAIVSAVYTGAARAKAFAAYGFAMGIAGVLGQLLGGALISADFAGSGWRGIFLINVPVGLVALAAVRVIPESRGARERLDLVGTELITLALAAVVLPLVEGREHGWPMWTWISFAAAPVLLGVFVVHQLGRRRAGRAPLVNLALFADRRFSLGSLAGLTFGLVPAGFFFVLALYLQQGRGFSALFSGVVFAAVGVGYFAAMLLAQPLAARFGRQVLAAGAIAVAAGCLVLADVAAASTSLELLPGLALIGFGIGLVLVPLSAEVLSEIDPADAGAAAGVLATAQQVGGALGVAVIGVVFFEALSGGVTHAFTVSLYALAGLTAATALLVQARLNPPAGGEPRSDRRRRELRPT